MSTILKILPTPGWVLLGFIMAVVVIVVVWWRLPHRSISYDVVHQDTILEAGSSDSKVQILVDSKPTPEVSLVVVKIINSGRSIIKRKEQMIPIGISFGQNAQVLEVAIKQCRPASMVVKAQVKDNRVVVKPFTLKPGDYMTLKCLINHLEAVQVEARAAGIKEVKPVQQWSLGLDLPIYAALAVILGGLFWWNLHAASMLGLLLQILLAWALVVVIFLSSYSLFSQRK